MNRTVFIIYHIVKSLNNTINDNNLPGDILPESNTVHFPIHWNCTYIGGGTSAKTYLHNPLLLFVTHSIPGIYLVRNQIHSHGWMHSKNFPVAWYWKLRNEPRCFSEYLQEHYTRCITRAALFFKNVPGTFFNATHQVKQL